MNAESGKDRQTKFVAKLLSSSIWGWEETADPDTFQAKLDNFVVQIARRFEAFDDDPYYVVLLFNSSGKLLEAIPPVRIDPVLFEALTGHSRDSGLESLYERARREALDVDKALDQATKDLDKFGF